MRGSGSAGSRDHGRDRAPRQLKAGTGRPRTQQTPRDLIAPRLHAPLLPQVIGRFNDLVTKLLLEGALHGIKRHGGNPDEVPVVWVPGCFEIPLVCKKLGQSGKYDVVIAIGAVVRGATTHYDSVAGAATSGILGAGMDTGVPVVFGVLTCDTMEQAMDRAGGKVGNKGYEAAVTAIEMANLYKVLPVK